MASDQISREMFEHLKAKIQKNKTFLLVILFIVLFRVTSISKSSNTIHCLFNYSLNTALHCVPINKLVHMEILFASGTA